MPTFHHRSYGFTLKMNRGVLLNGARLALLRATLVALNHAVVLGQARLTLNGYDIFGQADFLAYTQEDHRSLVLERPVSDLPVSV
ncbi:hypothetical protein [Deinococcus sp. UYEF24]